MRCSPHRGKKSLTGKNSAGDGRTLLSAWGLHTASGAAPSTAVAGVMSLYPGAS